METFTRKELIKRSFKKDKGRDDNYLAKTFGDGRVILAKNQGERYVIHGAYDQWMNWYDEDAIENLEFEKQIKTLRDLEIFLKVN